VLLHLDQAAFTAINTAWANPLFDAIMPWWRSRVFWYPAYAALLAWLLWRFRWRALPFLALVVLALAVGETLSSHLIKPWVGRLRPCQEPALVDTLRLLVACGPAPSFPSSHAVNHACLAVVLSRGLGWLARWLTPLLALWAASIALGQVYVGVHYPLDVVAGAALGAAVGWGSFTLYRRLGGTLAS
jgi:membrane-associated phospholipid phosphatase